MAGRSGTELEEAERTPRRPGPRQRAYLPSGRRQRAAAVRDRAPKEGWRGVEGRDADVDERAISGATVQARHERAYEANPCAPKLHLRGKRRQPQLRFEGTYEANPWRYDLRLSGEKRSAVCLFESVYEANPCRESRCGRPQRYGDAMRGTLGGTGCGVRGVRA